MAPPTRFNLLDYMIFLILALGIAVLLQLVFQVYTANTIVKARDSAIIKHLHYIEQRQRELDDTHEEFMEQHALGAYAP